MDKPDVSTEQPLPTFPPEGVTMADGSPLPRSGEVRLEPVERVQTVGPFWFCFVVDGSRWGDLALYAPGPEDAVATAHELSRALSAALRRLRYRHIEVTARPGRCP